MAKIIRPPANRPTKPEATVQPAPHPRLSYRDPTGDTAARRVDRELYHGRLDELLARVPAKLRPANR